MRAVGPNGSAVVENVTVKPHQLTRLSEVNKAVTGRKPVFVCHSEVYANEFAPIGVATTSAPTGATSWTTVNVTPLTGAYVTVVVPPGTVGQQFLVEVRSVLLRVVATMEIVRQLAPARPRPTRRNYNSPDASDSVSRRVKLTPASSIAPSPVWWTWDGRLAVGTLGLLAGGEGLGKSTLAYWLAARLTRGDLPGEHYGTPRGVLVCATEDSWAHTIVPRLIAADADLSRVFRVEVWTGEQMVTGLRLPRDLRGMETAATQAEAALLILDPLISRLSETLDTHRDGDVRQALEPLVAVADKTRMAILGIIHHNKSGSSDPLQLVMASKAFTAVARSVCSVIRDPDDETDTRRLFGTPKNNLGRQQPTLAFTIVGHDVDTPQGVAHTGRLVWSEDEVHGTIADAMRRAAADDDGDRSASTEAAGWLSDFMQQQGMREVFDVPSVTIKREAAKQGHNGSALQRARTKLGLRVTSTGFPRTTYWSLPVVSQSCQIPRGDDTTDLTDTTGGQSSQLCQLCQSNPHTGTCDRRNAEPTGWRRHPQHPPGATTTPSTPWIA